MQISLEDKAAIKSQLVPVMIALGNPPTSRLQAQIGEGLATVAEKDFPDEWGGLVDVSDAYSSLPRRTTKTGTYSTHPMDGSQELVASLSPDNFVINNGVLATAHSIFKRYVQENTSSNHETFFLAVRGKN